MPADAHRQRIERAFTEQAAAFEDSRFNRLFTADAAWTFERLPRGPEDPVAEMRRCVRVGGWLAVADLVADADPAVAVVQNELEQLRDPSHVRMLDAGELAALAGAAGWREVSVECRAVGRPLAPWLEQAHADADAAERIRALLEEEIAGGGPTGFSPRRVEGDIWFAQTFASCVASR